MSSGLQENLLQRLSDRLSAEIGLYFPPNRLEDLRRRLQPIMGKLPFGEFDRAIAWLVAVEWDQEKLDLLAQCLTIGETYFFRDANLWEYLEKKVLPDLFSKIGLANRSINIWSAASCTGEEPYTLAMLLDMMRSPVGKHAVKIVATDVNAVYLEQAKRGLYSTWSLRATPTELKERYFIRQSDNKYQLSEEIRSSVTFGYHNLVSTARTLMQPDNGFDIIFCRNVLIYFPEHQTRATIADLGSRLKDNGLLIISPHDCWCADPKLFETIITPGVVVLRKRAAGESVKDASFVNGSPSQSPAATIDNLTQASLPKRVETPATIAVRNPVSIPSPVQVTASEPAERRSLSAVMESAPVDGLAVVAGAQVQPSSSVGGLLNLNSVSAEIQRGEYGLAYTKLMAALEAGDQRPELLRLLVISLESLRDPGQALNWIEHAIKLYPLNYTFYYLKGSLLQQDGAYELAVKALRQAIFIDSNFVMAHFAMANCLRHMAKFDDAYVYLRNASKLLERFNPFDIIPESDGLTARQLLEIVSSRRMTLYE